MSAERPIIELYQKGTFEFLEMGAARRSVANFSLEETLQDVPTTFWGFFGIYPILPVGTKAAFMAFSTTAAEPSMSKALQLQIPERIRRLTLPIDPMYVKSMEILLARAHRPSKVLAFGERIRTGEETAMLVCIYGENPETALREIQQRIREASAKRN